MPDRALIYDKHEATRISPIKHFMASRGCPYNCTYCFNHAWYQIYTREKRGYQRSVDSVIEEVLWVKERYPLEQVVSRDPPVWADVPFLTAVPTHNGVGQEGNFLFDTGAQISIISERLGIDIGLDSNGDGQLNEDDVSFLTTQTVGGVGGQVTVPVFSMRNARTHTRLKNAASR